MKRRRYGLKYYRIPKGLPNAGKIMLTAGGHHYLYNSVKEMLADSPMVQKYGSQNTLDAFSEQ